MSIDSTWANHPHQKQWLNNIDNIPSHAEAGNPTWCAARMGHAKVTLKGVEDICGEPWVGNIHNMTTLKTDGLEKNCFFQIRGILGMSMVFI